MTEQSQTTAPPGDGPTKQLLSYLLDP